MSLKKYIDSRAQKVATNIFGSLGFARKAQSTSFSSGLVEVKSIKDGKYIVELPDGSTKEITPYGRSVGPGGHIVIAGDQQVY